MKTENINIIPKDTTVEAFKIQLSIMKNMAFEDRFNLLLQLNENVRKLAEAGVKDRHPEYDVPTLKMAYIKLVHGEELFLKCFPYKKVDV